MVGNGSFLAIITNQNLFFGKKKCAKLMAPFFNFLNPIAALSVLVSKEPVFISKSMIMLPAAIANSFSAAYQNLKPEMYANPHQNTLV